MAGCNVPYGDEEKRYLVCWDCGMLADHVKNGQPNWVQRIRPNRAPHRKKKRKKNRIDGGGLQNTRHARPDTDRPLPST
jgi:hypothetical protein